MCVCTQSPYRGIWINHWQVLLHYYKGHMYISVCVCVCVCVCWCVCVRERKKGRDRQKAERGNMSCRHYIWTCLGICVSLRICLSLRVCVFYNVSGGACQVCIFLSLIASVEVSLLSGGALLMHMPSIPGNLLSLMWRILPWKHIPHIEIYTALMNLSTTLMIDNDCMNQQASTLQSAVPHTFSPE